MKRELAFESTWAIANVKEVYNHALTIVNKINDGYKNLELKSLDMDGLRSLIANQDEYIKNQFADLIETPTYGPGLKMKKADFINTLELPDYNPVINAVREFHAFLAKRETTEIIHGSDVLSCFQMVNNSIEINESELQTRLDGHRIFATNPKQKEILDGLNALVNAYKDFDRLVNEVTGGSRLKDYRACIFLEDPLAPELKANSNFYQQITSTIKI
jgi:hypothetical protein